MCAWSHSVDKRSRESPDSTLEHEHKSLRTSGLPLRQVPPLGARVAVATDEEPNVNGPSEVDTTTAVQHDIEPQTIRWNVREEAEIRPTMWRLYHSSPAWKLKMCVDAMKVRPIDLSSLGQMTRVRFASDELVETAVDCLEGIIAESKQDDASQQVTSESVEAPTKDQASSAQPTSSDAAAPKSESTAEVMPTQQPDAVASEEKENANDRSEPVQEQPNSSHWGEVG